MGKFALNCIHSLQAPGRCRGSSRVVLKTAPGIGDQRRVLLKPLRKPIFVVRSRNSRRSSVGAGPPIVSLIILSEGPTTMLVATTILNIVAVRSVGDVLEYFSSVFGIVCC